MISTLDLRPLDVGEFLDWREARPTGVRQLNIGFIDMASRQPIDALSLIKALEISVTFHATHPDASILRATVQVSCAQ